MWRLRLSKAKTTAQKRAIQMRLR
jgi:hypothetical protein